MFFTKKKNNTKAKTGKTELSNKTKDLKKTEKIKLSNKTEDFKKAKKVKPSFGKKNLYPFFLVLFLAATFGFLIWHLTSGLPDPSPVSPPVVLAKEIEILPEKGDIFGIDADTKFLLKTKANISLGDIQKNLKIIPEISFEAKAALGDTNNPAGVKESGRNEFEITPKEKLETGEIYQLTFPFENKNLSWAFEVKPKFKVISTIPRNEAVLVPLNAGIEIVFNRQGFSNPEQFFEIIPNVPGRFETRGDALIFIAKEKLKEKTVYLVKIKKGMLLEDSKDVLSEDFVFSFETKEKEENEKPYFHFVSDFVEVLQENDPVLGVSYNNLEIANQNFNLYQFSTIEEFLKSYKDANQNKLYWARFQTLDFEPEAGKKILSFQPKIIEGEENIIIIPQLLGEGYYLLETEVGKNKKFCWIQSSLVSNYFSKTNQNSFAWIFDFSKKSPIDGAKIGFFGQEEEFFTDKNGFVEFQTPEYLKDENLNFLIIEKSGYLKKVALVFGKERNWRYWRGGGEDLYFDYLNTDRSLYRTEDTVYFWGAVKGRMENLIQKKLRVELSASYGSEEPLFQKNTVVSNYGTVSGDFPFKNIPPGFYSLNLYHGDKLISHTYFEIGIFSKPLYQIKISSEAEDMFLGEEAKFKIKAEFFDGTPLSLEELKYKTYFKGGGDEGEIKLDDKGEGQITVKPKYTKPTDETHWPSNFDITVWPSLFEEGEIEGRTKINVFGPKMEIRTFNEYDENKVKITAKLNEINLKKEEGHIGEAVKNYLLDLKITEITHKKIKTGQRYDHIEKVFYDTFRYERQEEVIETLSRKTDENGEWILERELNPKKDYLFTFRGEDKSGNKFIKKDYVNVSVYGYISKWRKWDEDGDVHIYLRTVRENEEREKEYKIGEKASLIIERSDEESFLEKENFLFFGFQNKIEKTIISSISEENFTFEEKHIPNIRFRAVWFSDKGFKETNDLNFSFDNARRKLDIEILTDEEKYRPGDSVNIQIKTKKNDLPKKAEAKIALIDEALLAIAPDYYKTDIYSFYNDVYLLPTTMFSHYLTLESKTDAAEGGGCFGKGTKVLMASGKEKNIEEVKSGDMILTRGPENSSELIPAAVQHASSHIVAGYLLINNNLKVTPEHKIFLNGKWQEAAGAKKGDFVLDKNGKDVKIEKIEIKKERAEVYNIIIGKLHTFFANGIFVHNAEKGAETRENFPDMALYKVMELKDGFGDVKFELPDNLTSWRIIVEAISKDLDVGKETKNISVSLPFFVNLILSEDYLLEDKPKVIAKAFGKEYFAKESAPVSFTLSLPELNFSETIKSENGTAIFSLPEISKKGEYRIKLEGNWQNFSDAILRKISFKKTPFQKMELKLYDLSNSLSKIEGNKEGITNLVFLDKIKGRVFYALKRNLWHFGERAEKKISPFIASRILKEYFGEDGGIDETDLSSYKVNGGISLLPWADDDVLASAMIASLSPEIFLKYGSSFYFEEILKSGDRTNLDKSIAFFGLASLSEPVLNKINLFEKYNELGAEEKAYISLAKASLGDCEGARKIYFGEIRKNIVFRSDAAYLDLGNEDKKIKLTGLLAGLCASLNEEDQFGLSEYLFQNTPKKDLKILESLIYVKNFLSSYAPDYSASFDYKIGGKKGSAVLDKGKILKLQVLPEELLEFEFSNVEGEIQLQSWFEKPITKEELQKSEKISVSKIFLLGGKETTEFKRGDLVLIRINPNFLPDAPNGRYTITDWLPSGFKPIVKSFRKEQWEGSSICHPVWHPTFFQGNKMSFSWRKESDKSSNCPDRDMSYYARAVMPGTYMAPAVIMQSSKAPEVITASDETMIEIKN